MEGGKLGEDLFFFFFASHFSKPLKFVLGLPKWKFSNGKKYFMPGKKSEKITLPPSERFSCYTPVKVSSTTDRSKLSNNFLKFQITN